MTCPKHWPKNCTVLLSCADMRSSVTASTSALSAAVATIKQAQKRARNHRDFFQKGELEITSNSKRAGNHALTGVLLAEDAG